MRIKRGRSRRVSVSVLWESTERPVRVALGRSESSDWMVVITFSRVGRSSRLPWTKTSMRDSVGRDFGEAVLGRMELARGGEGKREAMSGGWGRVRRWLRNWV